MARRQPTALAAAIRQWSRKCPPQLVWPGCAHLFFVDTAKAVADQLSDREAILDLEADLELQDILLRREVPVCDAQLGRGSMRDVLASLLFLL